MNSDQVKKLWEQAAGNTDQEKLVSFLVALLSAGKVENVTTTKLDYGRDAYLAANKDLETVAEFRNCPLSHFVMHGFNEKRTWPVLPSEDVWTQKVLTPNGRSVPRPVPVTPKGWPGENLMGYIGRVANAVDKTDFYRRVAGTIFLGLGHLIPKSVPSDKHGEYQDDPNNWPQMAEDFLFPKPQAADPGWQDVYERMGTREPSSPTVRPSAQLPSDETPL